MYPDTKSIEAQKSPAVTASAPVNKNISTTQIKVNDACNVDIEPSEAEVIASREQKEFWMKTHHELKELLSKYKYVPSGEKSESDGTKYYKWWKDSVSITKTDSKSEWLEWAYYDVTIKLQDPVTVQWHQYNEVYLNVSPDASFGLTRFENTGNTFPKLRFNHSSAYKNPEVLCLDSRYYDDVDWVRLDNSISQWKPTPFSQADFKNLVEIALKKIKN